MFSLFIIYVSRCCFCGLCVEAYLEEAIRVDTGCLEFGERNRKNLIDDLDKLFC